MRKTVLNMFGVLSLMAAVWLLTGVASLAFAQSDETMALNARRQGARCQQAGDFAKALYYYENSSVLSPGNPEIHNDMGLMHEYLGHKKEAEANYRKAIEITPSYLPAYANLGLFYEKQGQYALAIQYLRHRVEFGRPDDPWTLQAQEELEAMYSRIPELKEDRIRQEADRLSESVAASKKRVKQKANRDQAIGFEIAYEKGVRFLEEGAFDLAIDSLETAVALNPRHAGAQHALRRARFDKERLMQNTLSAHQKKESQGVLAAQALESMSSR